MHFREHFFPIGKKKILFRALYEYKTLKFVKSIQFMGLNKHNSTFKLCFTSKENQGLIITANNINSSAPAHSVVCNTILYRKLLSTCYEVICVLSVWTTVKFSKSVLPFRGMYFNEETEHS